MSDRLAIAMTGSNAVAEILDMFWHNVRSDLLLERASVVTLYG
jgi:hypothetical protein